MNVTEHAPNYSAADQLAINGFQEVYEILDRACDKIVSKIE